MIYVVQASIGGPVKIGHTSGDALRGRLNSLQTSCPWPLVVLRTMPGTVKDEWALHRRFAAQRLHGEWFELEGSFREWVTGVRPLATGPARVLAALLELDRWARSGDVAKQLGVDTNNVAGVLSLLHRRHGRVLRRSAVANGIEVAEWRTSESLAASTVPFVFHEQAAAA